MSALLQNPFDHASRGLLRRAGMLLLCWLLRVLPETIRFERWIDTRLSLPEQPERVCDTIAHVWRLDEGQFPYAIPVEFQAAPDPLMLGRMMVYGGMIWIQEKPTDLVGDRFHLAGVVVNLTGVGDCGRRMPWRATAGTPPAKRRPRAKRKKAEGPQPEWTLVPVEWNLETLDAHEILEGAARGELPLALLAWMSLMKNGGDPAILRRWREVAELEKDPVRKADLALVVVFAQLTDRVDEWKKALEGFNVTESVIFNELIAKGEAKGETKGETKGLLVGLEAVLDLRFAEPGLALMPEFRKIEDPARLAAIVRHARTAATLDDFRRDTEV